MALPVYFYNAEPSLASSDDVLIVNPHLSIAIAFMSNSINTLSNLPPWHVLARDDQTGDCIRDGMCRD
ncbi:hypothetical protein [Fortiea sp. LEGE XX443]|nr:hypothetical protein [Fortiea sp. LEGE XX443]